MYKRSEVEKNALEYFGDTLVANVWLDKYALKIGEDEYLELSPNDTLVRLAKELYRIELKYPNPMTYEEIYKLLEGYNHLVLGGSSLFGIGNTNTLSTLGNCFVVDSPIDSYAGIFKTDQELAQLMKRRGGVGVDISTLRPRGSKVNNAASSSTGAVTFMNRFSNTTREVAQEGRRGALMVSMDVRHPDIEEFITAKNDLTKITGANISVRVDNSFMNAVGQSVPIANLFVDSEGKSIYSEQIFAKTIWDKLIHQAWKNGEPGILFWDHIIKESPADCYPEFETITTNPCSELPLCAYDSCRLAAINLYSYVTNPFTSEAKFDFDSFEDDVKRSQRIMDDIVDLEMEKINAIIMKIESDPEPKELKEVELELWNKIYGKLLLGRRTGLGIMGLADAFAALNMKYGSPDSADILNKIGSELVVASYVSSTLLARERGAFPLWNSELEKDNPFIKRVLEMLYDFGYHDVLEDYRNFGRRNIANLTVAPTGSISMLAGVSSGMEPVFALSYTRKRKVSADNPNKKFQDKSGDWWEEYVVLHPIYQCWTENHYPELVKLDNGDVMTSSRNPYLGSTAHEINPYDKLNLQAILQQYIDHSISVTYNLPSTTTEEEVSNLYMKAWQLGLKGLTVYREGSRDGVLTTKKQDSFRQYDAPKRPKVLLCDVYSMMSKGKHWIVCVGLFDSKPYEVFAFNEYNLKGSQYAGELIKVSRGKYNLNMRDVALIEDITKDCSDEENLLTRMISTSLRHGADIKFVVEQLSKSEGDVTSFGKAIARTLRRYIKDGELKGNPCPTCGTIMVSEGGCWICKQCGNNKCE